MHKNQLQELAQRSCFNLPSYACIREGPDHAPRFKATVNFNGETFESPTFCATLRQAEHAAAEVALDVLSKKGPSKALAARVLDETGIYKNLLQETAHRAGLKLPVYSTVRSASSHVPAFSSTVELAGMSFTGELAKTKKQAQKNAAMAAWSSLKQLSQPSSSSCSSSLVECEINGEQEQVTVARYLSCLKLPEMSMLSQRDHQHGQSSPLSLRIDMIPFPYSGDSSLYPMQWACSPFSTTAAALYPGWPHERAALQQSPLLALPSALPATPGAQYFPLIRPVMPLQQGPYQTATGHEAPMIYLSNHSMPVPVRSLSRVSIQEEIEENPRVEEGSLYKNASSNHWKAIMPTQSRGSRTEASNPPVFLTSHSDARSSEMQQQDDEKKSKPETASCSSPVHEKTSTKQFHRAPKFNNIRFRPGPIAADETKYRSQTSCSPFHFPSKTRPQNTTLSGSSRFGGFVPPLSAGRVCTSPVTSNPQALSLQQTRNSAPRCISRPWLEGMSTAGMPPVSCPAPAVHIRSVVPVCSAPPAKKMPSPSQEKPSSGAEKEMTEKKG